MSSTLENSHPTSTLDLPSPFSFGAVSQFTKHYLGMLSRSPRLGSATSPVSLQMTNFPPHFGTYKHSATSHNHCGYQISQWIYKIRFIWQDYILQDSINGYSFVFNFTLIQSMQIERQVCWGGPTNTQPAFTEAEKDLGVMNSFSGHRIWQSFKLSKFWHNYGH